LQAITVEHRSIGGLWRRPGKDASLREMRNNAGDQRRNGGSARFNDQTGCYTVERVANCVQIA
jgi:hypothetical protein